MQRQTQCDITCVCLREDAHALSSGWRNWIVGLYGNRRGGIRDTGLLPSKEQKMEDY